MTWYRSPLLVCALHPVGPVCIPWKHLKTLPVHLHSEGAHLLPLPCPEWQVHQRSNDQFDQFNVQSFKPFAEIRGRYPPDLHLHWSKLSHAQRCSMFWCLFRWFEWTGQNWIAFAQRRDHFASGPNPKSSFIVWDAVWYDFIQFQYEEAKKDAFFPHIRCQIGRTVSVAKPHTSTSPLTCLNLRFRQA